MVSIKKTMAGIIRSTLRHAGLGVLHALRLIKGVNSIDAVFMPRIALSYQFYLEHRDKGLPRDFSAVRDAGQAGLISVILPVYNGEAFLAEAIESVLSQTYILFELIIVDDGSTDATPKILGDYASKDVRVKVIHQPNRKLPEALNTGFRCARGQYLTWTSHDNRMRPDCLAKMVTCINNNPKVDMVYANYEIIGEDGARIEDAPFCATLQRPVGSGIIDLPRDVSMIQYINGNFIGPAFLYRRRVLDLVGDYSPHWFTCEDYDYFLRVNEQMTLRRLDADDPIYEYRIHQDSLSASSDALGINKRTEALMAFDDHRRDIAIGPVAWVFDLSEMIGSSEPFIHEFAERIQSIGDIIINDIAVEDYETIPRIFLRLIDDNRRATMAPVTNVNKYDSRILIYIGDTDLPTEVHREWDLCMTYVDDKRPLLRLDGHRQGWLGFQTAPACLRMARLRTIGDKMAHEENTACTTTAPSLALSVIICTCRGSEQLAVLLESLRGQSLAADQFELVIVNNDPGNIEEAFRISKVCKGAHPLPESVHVVPCAPAGLSRARNAGLAHARGEIVHFLDDDAVADPHLLEEILKPYREDETLGVVGGVIDLALPEPAPVWMGRNLWPYWSHYHPEGGPITYLDDWRTFPYGANWSARRNALRAIGGFRTAYGRNGTLVDSGEETIAAVQIKKLGYKVASVSSARVIHKVNPQRFTLLNLFQTVRGGYDVAIQMEIDHYIEFRLSPLELMVHGIKRFGYALYPGRDSISQRIQDLCIMVGCFHGAIRLTCIQLRRLAGR